MRTRAPGIVLTLALLAGCQNNPQGDREPTVEPPPIQEDFGSKLVYGTDPEADTALLERHCADLGGTFNECGSVCPPGTDICAAVCAFTCEGLSPEGPAPERRGWESTNVEAYGFTLRYPAHDWSYRPDTSFALSPKFNLFLKPQGIPLDLPLDHFANVTNVSVYPKGIPTEGLLGQSRPLDIPTPFEASDESRIYLLENGAPFAAFIKPAIPPRGWTESGFIWMRVRVEDLDTRCMRSGAVVPMPQCDPMVRDDRIVREGTVPEGPWKVEKEILAEVSLEAQETGSSVSSDILIQTPAPGDTVSGTLTVTGQARGNWYFEGTFHVTLASERGETLAEGPAEAQGQWTTEELVPFRARLRLEDSSGTGGRAYAGPATLTLQKANPSGRPEMDESRDIPLIIADPSASDPDSASRSS